MGGDQEWKHKSEVTKNGMNKHLFQYICFFQHKTPIYNLGAGTCLGVKKKATEAAVIMRLCTDPDLNMWDLISQ